MDPNVCIYQWKHILKLGPFQVYYVTSGGRWVGMVERQCVQTSNNPRVRNKQNHVTFLSVTALKPEDGI
jgi:hypothetical protein